MSALAARMGTAVQYRASSPLSDEQIARIAPSVFAAEAHGSRSERYSYIPTIDVLNGLRKEGFQPFMVAQGRTRVPGKAEFTKHMLRLRHEGDINGTEANEVILINSHDGTSSYQMLAGMFRFVCCNGVVCGDTLRDIRIKHSGNITDNVVQGAFEVLDGFNLIREVTEGMKGTTLSRDEQRIFADAALMLKYDPADDEHVAPIDASQLLQTRRMEDRDPTLWTTFNKVQENVIRGGLQGVSANGRRTRTREVTAIDTNVKLNRALWTLAERMAELKTA
jgi:hypothetical protein